jgi:uncharacterized protein
MRPLILILAACFSFPAFAQTAAPAPADPPATEEQVRHLFEVMDIRKQSHLMMDSMQQQMRAMSDQTIRARYPNISPAELAKLNRVSDDMLKDMPLDAMLDDMIPVYQKHLSQTDVDAMVVFYQSPTGKKLMQEMPQITQEAMQVSYKRMEKQIDAVMQRVEDLVKQEQKEKNQQKNTPANPPTKSD